MEEKSTPGFVKSSFVHHLKNFRVQSEILWAPVGWGITAGQRYFWAGVWRFSLRERWSFYLALYRQIGQRQACLRNCNYNCCFSQRGMVHFSIPVPMSQDMYPFTVTNRLREIGYCGYKHRKRKVADWLLKAIILLCTCLLWVFCALAELYKWFCTRATWPTQWEKNLNQTCCFLSQSSAKQTPIMIWLTRFSRAWHHLHLFPRMAPV